MASKPNTFAMDRHVEALERIAFLESIVRRVPNYCVMRTRYARGELSWANSINEFERDVIIAIPKAFENQLPLGGSGDEIRRYD